jgi:hypothetical protein
MYGCGATMKKKKTWRDNKQRHKHRLIGKQRQCTDGRGQNNSYQSVFTFQHLESFSVFIMISVKKMPGMLILTHFDPTIN